MICFQSFIKESIGLGYFQTISENLKYYFSFQPSVDNTNPNMAHVFVRFPHLAESIFQELDNFSLFHCQIAAKSCKKFIEQSKLYYIRKIKHYTNCNNDTLKKMLHRSDVNAAINLASKVSEFYEKHHRYCYTGNVCNMLTICTKCTLHEAARHGHLEVCTLIIDQMDDKNPKMGEFLDTPLHGAALNGNLYICKLIVDNIYDKSPRDCNKRTPIHYAADRGHLEVCILLLNNIEFALYKNPRDIYGTTPLHMAALNGHLEVCKLVRYVKDKNPRDYAGNTPLHLAAIDGHSAVYKLLVDYGGNDNLINNQGETANELMVRTLTGPKWNFHY
jgi:hypothetical protein